MDEKEISAYLSVNIEPFNLPLFGVCYPASVKLKDGFQLPCVMFSSKKFRVDKAIQRFKEDFGDERPHLGYRSTVEAFVAFPNVVTSYDIQEVSPCLFAIPKARFLEIQGETGMGWTGFTAVMKDGKELRFIVTNQLVFLNFPEGYTGKDVAAIKPHRQPTKRDLDEHNFHSEKTFFACFIEGV